VSVPFLTIPQDPLGDENFGTYRDPDTDYRLRQFEPIAEYGWEIHTHACGDAAIRQTMDVYKILMDRILADNPGADFHDDRCRRLVGEIAVDDAPAPERMARHTPYKMFTLRAPQVADESLGPWKKKKRQRSSDPVP
jgi:hypothetical protein